MFLKSAGSIFGAVLLFWLPAAAQVPQIERDALIALYNSTDGANWTDNTNWLGVAGTECTWFGVTCSGGHVEQLSISDNQLNGTLPPQLGDLPNLLSLWLFANQITGGIPPELGNLSNLYYLQLGDNQLSGGIPSELGNLSNLVSLKLFANQLDGSIPSEIGGLSNLQSLDLSENQLSGSIPPELGNLTNLDSLWIAGNQLTGSIPAELGDLTNLNDLWLYSNQLSGEIPPELGMLPNLSQLSLNSNQLSGAIPPELATLSNLTRLELARNQLSGSIPPELGSCSNLTHLWLDHNQLSGGIPPELGSCPNLTFLWLDHNQLTGPIPPELGSLSNLMQMRLSANRLSGTIPNEVTGLSSLTTLMLYGNQFSGSIPSGIADLSNLSSVNISFNALWTEDVDLQVFLDTIDPYWFETQTIAPDGVTIGSVSDRTVWLEWNPVEWPFGHGGYEVFVTEIGSADRHSAGYTVSKEVTTFPVTGLQPGTAYDLSIETYTRPHLENQNRVASDPTEPSMVTTSDSGCATPTVSISGDSLPYTLTVTSDHDSYEWVTGEQTASILVRPHWATWYWVKTSGPGGCEEAGAVLAPVLFADDFESGNLNYWSDIVY